MPLIASSHQSSQRERCQGLCPLLWSSKSYGVVCSWVARPLKNFDKLQLIQKRGIARKPSMETHEGWPKEQEVIPYRVETPKGCNRSKTGAFLETWFGIFDLCVLSACIRLQLNKGLLNEWMNNWMAGCHREQALNLFFVSPKGRGWWKLHR